MSKKSYKIKHDFLFDEEDLTIEIIKFNENIKMYKVIYLTDILKTKSEKSFYRLIETKKKNVLLKDDIGNCINPASEQYKQFIIRCISRKLQNKGITVYL